MAQEYTDYSIFVGDLAPEVDDGMLEQHFRTYYPTVKQAKVMIDQATGRSRGFGFVRFTSEADRDRAIQEVNGTYIGSKPVRCSLATQKPRPGGGSAVAPTHTTGGPSGGGSSHASTATTTTGRRDDAGDAGPPNNTTLFIGGLSSSVSEAELHAAFARCGEIVYVKIPPGKGCGFVQFVTRTAAEFALETMNGLPLGGMPIRVSWGKSTKAPGGPHYPSGGHPHAPPGPAYGAPGYGYGAGYDPYAPAAYGGYGYAMDPYGYGYAAAAADPYAGYPGYAAHAGPAHPAAHPAAAAANAAAAAAAAHAGATSHGAPAAVQPMLYDPLVPLDVAKMNMAYMHRHVPVLTGAYVRVPIAMAPVAPHQMPMQVRPVHHDVS